MALLLVTSLDDEPFEGGETPGAPDGSGLSLREAIGLANADPASADQIEFDPTLSGGTLVLTQGQLEPLGAVQIDGDIDGDGTFDITIDADGISRAFFVDGTTETTQVTLNGLQVTGGYALPGSAVLAIGPDGNPTGTIEISDSRFEGNTAALVPSAEDPGAFLYGGPPTIAIHATDAVLDGVDIVGNDGSGFGIAGVGGYVRPIANVSDTLVENNTGGGLQQIYQSRLYVEGSTITGNGERGVGFYSEGSGDIVGSTISENDGGGAFFGFNASVDIVGTQIVNNGANATRGGGIFATYSDVDLFDSAVSGNTAPLGGGIYWDTSIGILQINGGEISGNTATFGGGIYHKSGRIYIGEGSYANDPEAVSITGNTAAKSGGGVHVVSQGGGYSSQIASLTDVTISGNIAGLGAGIYTVSTADPAADPLLTVSNGTIAENTGTLKGGGLLNLGANVALINTTVADNMSARGAGVANTGGLAAGDLALTNSIVIGNDASIVDDDIEGTATLVGGNILGDTFSINGAPVTAGLARGDVLDGTLSDNGGGIDTIRLVNNLSNPALDGAEDSLAPSTDARGISRPIDLPGIANNGANAADLGALEIAAGGQLGLKLAGTGDVTSPEFRVLADGLEVGSGTVPNPILPPIDVSDETIFDTFFFPLPDPLPEEIGVQYVNDGAEPGSNIDRNLIVDSIELANGVLESEIDGFFTPDGPVPNAEGPREILFWNGTLAFDIATITVVAGGTGGPDALPAFEVLVDGASVGDATILDPQTNAEAATGFETDMFVFLIDPDTPPETVTISFDSDGSDPGTGEDVNLFVDSIVVGGVAFESEIAGDFTPSSPALADDPRFTGPREALWVNGDLEFDLGLAVV